MEKPPSTSVIAGARRSSGPANVPQTPRASLTAPAYPPTRREEVAETLHGVRVEDPYRWLEDETAPEVQAWMKAEDALARERLARLPGRDALVRRFRELYYLDRLSAPLHRGGRYFFVRSHADREKAIVYWKEGRGGAEQVLLDPNGWDEALSLGEWVPSWDGRRVAYQVRPDNSDEATLHVIDVSSGEVSCVDVIAGAKYAVPSWTPEGDGFYYTWLPTDAAIAPSDLPGHAAIRFHRLGEPPPTDRVVRERTGDPTAFVGAALSRDGHWLVFTISHGWTSSDCFYRDLRAAEGSLSGGWLPLAVGMDALYEVEAWRDLFYVKTNEGAANGRVFVVDPRAARRESWREIVPERSDATLEGMAVLGERLVITYLKDASSALEVRELDGRLVREVELPGLGTISEPVGNEDEDEAYISFESYTVPREIYRMSIGTGRSELYERLKLPVDPSPYAVEQVFFPARDGTRLSMFLVHRKDLAKDGEGRVLLTGYGGFQIAITPSFQASLYPWLERGGIYAEVNLRGGSEYGEDWHRHGMLLEKQNTFDDFLVAAEYLVAGRYTTPGRLVIEGGSNGGLLVGAALTQRPELFAAVVCAVPLLDMLRYHRFGSGQTWVEEYGSAEDSEQFRALHAYSPYHRVAEGVRYPAVLFLSADHDDRVDPMHARKMAAALQAASTGGAVLLRIEAHAGHGGADLVRSRVEQSADVWSFVLAATQATLAPGAASPPG